MDKRWIIIQPTYVGGVQINPAIGWTNDPFVLQAKLFQAPLYNIIDRNIPLDADAYLICNLSSVNFRPELELINKIKANGGKVLIGFSQDSRFLHGGGLIHSDGILYTELCDAADGIVNGVNPNIHMFGRFQHKAIPIGDYLQDFNWNVPFEQRDIDLVTSGPGGEECLSFEIEFLLGVKEKYPEKRVVCCIIFHHAEIINSVTNRFPQIEFPQERGKSLIDYMKRTKFYYNVEIRPRPGRAIVEAYYCRVPFVAPYTNYFSCLCPEYAFKYIDFKEMMEKYEAIMAADRDKLISDMEARAKNEMFDAVYKRIKEKLWGEV